MVTILGVQFPSHHVFGLLMFTMNLRKTKNSYFENQTQQRENNSLYTVYALV